MQEKITELETAKKNVAWLLEHGEGLVDMHGIVYWAEMVVSLRNIIKNSL